MKYIGLMRHYEQATVSKYGYRYEYHREDEALQPLPFEHYWRVCMKRLGVVSEVPGEQCTSADEPLICFEVVRMQGRQVLIDFEPKIND